MRIPDGRVRKFRRSCEDSECAHELTFSCYKGLPLLGRDRTRRWLVNALEGARAKQNLELWAYVIMPEHVHVLFVPRSASYRVRSILQAIKQPVAQRAIAYLKKNYPAWLARLDASGPGALPRHHFWQPGGGYDRNVNRARTAWSIVNYIHDNPVKRGLTERPTDWPWSSARWYEGDGEILLPMDGHPPKA